MMSKSNLLKLNKLLNSNDGFNESLAREYLSNTRKIKNNENNLITTEHKIKFNSFQDIKYKNNLSNLNTIETILNIFRDNNELIPIIQGSYADGTAYEGWSDLDMVLFIKEEMNISKLRDIYKKIKIIMKHILFSIQPLQHHGVFIIDKQSLNLYPESFMPSQAFKNAISYKKGAILLNQYLETNYFLDILEDRYQYIKNANKIGFYNHHKYQNLPLNLNKPEKCLYQIYAYINYLLLVPCITYSALGNSMYKGDILLESNKWPINKKTLLFFKKINEFRADWINNNFKPKKATDCLPDFLLKYINREFWKSSKMYEKEFIKFARKGFK